MSNVIRSLRFRELVALSLQAAGLPVTVKPFKHKLSERIIQEQGDILGLNSWCINDRNEYKFDWSGALDELTRDAKLDAKRKAALVQFRRGSGAGEAYVVMTLDTFAQVLRDELHVNV